MNWGQNRSTIDFSEKKEPMLNESDQSIDTVRNAWYAVSWAMRKINLNQPLIFNQTDKYNVGLRIGNPPVTYFSVNFISHVKQLENVVLISDDRQSEEDTLFSFGPLVGDDMINVNLEKYIKFIPPSENFNAAINDISLYLLLMRAQNNNVVPTESSQIQFSREDKLWRGLFSQEKSISKQLQILAFDDEPLEKSVSRYFIDQVLEIALMAGAQFGVSICRARVRRFRSQEIPGYTELVFSFFSNATQDRIIEFFPPFTESVGDWRKRQTEPDAIAFADQLSVEVLPLEFW